MVDKKQICLSFAPWFSLTQVSCIKVCNHSGGKERCFTRTWNSESVFLNLSGNLSLRISINASGNLHSFPPANCRHSWVPAGELLERRWPKRAGLTQTHALNSYSHMHTLTHSNARITTSKGRKRQSRRLLVILLYPPTESPPP